MNKTKFILLAVIIGLVALSCDMFEADPSVIEDDPDAYLAKMPWSQTTFQFAVSDKRAFLYNKAGTAQYGQIYFNGVGEILTFDINNEKKTASVVASTYDAKAQSVEYKAVESMNDYFDIDNMILVELDNINKGYLTTYQTNCVYTNVKTDGTNALNTDGSIKTNLSRVRTNTTTYLFYWTLKTTNDTVTNVSAASIW